MSPALLLAATTSVSTPALAPPLAGIGFLVGEWSSVAGHVAETGGTSSGTSSIEPVLGGAALLRRDHTVLTDSAGHVTGGFDQLMTIYAEGGTLHGDYLDGHHVIHYVNATVSPGRSVVFTTAPIAGMPSFRLSYTLAAPMMLTVEFAMAPPGTASFHPIATGSLTRGR